MNQTSGRFSKKNSRIKVALVFFITAG